MMGPIQPGEVMTEVLVLDPMTVLNGRLCDAFNLVGAMELAGGENPPPWVSVFRSCIEGITQAAEAVEVANARRA